ncbi:MAG: lactam utilization protein LamB [Kangiella sp.]|nr:MAG: lactam utilization protein LamB [Kangiella sp.]
MIDINCDLGEGKTQLDCEKDVQLMPFISRCNIACGGHAGNQLTMKLTVKNAIKHNLLIGAHPGYPDPDNFGRASMDISFEALKVSLLDQINQLNKIANSAYIELGHIKFHGALYNDIENDPALAENIAGLILKHFPTLSVICLAGGLLMEKCVEKNISIMQEAFIDRRYLSNKKLSPRTMNGSVIECQELAIKQALYLAHQLPVEAIDKRLILIKADTLCLHGDNQNSLDIARNLHLKLKKSGLKIQ